ncbi:MAG: hypothetical protein EOO13_15625, partial [Chitinophagaceae bacterium]
MPSKLLFILLNFFCLSVAAQQQIGNFMAYGAETRFLSGMNYRVFQSRTGYLWICSLNGIIRFDGRRYKNFFSDYLNPNSLTDNIVSDVAEDKNGKLWIAGFAKGVACYDQRTGLFKKYPALSKDNNPEYGVNKIYNDAQQNLWFATAGRGIAKYDFAKDSFELFYPEPRNATDGSERGFNFTTDILQDPFNPDELWVSGFHGLYLFNKKKKTFDRFACVSDVASSDILINDMELQQDRLLWLGTWGAGMKCFDIIQKKFIPKKIPSFSAIVYDMKLVNDSTLYIACLSKGLMQYNTRNNTITNITPVNNATHVNSQRTDIQRVSITPAAGVFASGQSYIYQQHPFYQRLNKNVAYTSAATYLTDIVWDPARKKYWYSSHDGIYSFDEHMQKVEKTLLLYAPVEGDLVFNMAIDAKSQLWASTRTTGLVKYNTSLQGFQPASGAVPLHDSLLASIRKIQADKAGNLWMYGRERIYYYEIKQNKITGFPIYWDKDYTRQRNIKGAELKVSPNGEAWLLSQQGIFIYNKNGFVQQLYKTGTTRHDLANQIVLTGAFVEKYKAFWFTSGDGLQVMNYEDHRILADHTIADGLPSMIIRGIVVDSLSRLWLATSAGLGYFDPTKKIWQTFNRFDGLETDFLDDGIFITKNNMLAIPQPGGFSFYKPGAIINATDTGYLRITTLLINNQPYADSILPEFIKQLELPYDQNNIVIEYAAMDWVYPAKTKYRYLIEGIPGQDTWMPNDEARLNFAGLQPGKYVLHVRAMNNSG